MNTNILKGGLIALVGLAIVIDLFVVRTDPSNTDVPQENQDHTTTRPRGLSLNLPDTDYSYERSSSESIGGKSKKYSKRICLKQSKSSRRLAL